MLSIDFLMQYSLLVLYAEILGERGYFNVTPMLHFGYIKAVILKK